MKSIMIEGLTRRFGRKVALSRLYLEAHSGEILAILGDSGSGKTTLLYILAALIPPSRGRVLVEGISVTRSPHWIRQVVQIVFATPCLDPYLTVGEHLEWAARLRGLTGTRRRAIVSEVLHALKLEGLQTQPVRALSLEARHRLEIARGLTGEAPVRLLDNPAGPLEPSDVEALWEYLRNRCRIYGETVLWATHNPSEAERADRVAVLDEGRLIALDTPSGLRHQVAPDTVVLHTLDNAQAAAELKTKLQMEVERRPDGIYLSIQRPEALLSQALTHLKQEVTSVCIRQPTFHEVILYLREGARREVDIL